MSARPPVRNILLLALLPSLLAASELQAREPVELDFGSLMKSSAPKPYRITVISDDQAVAKAQEFIDNLAKTRPFDLLIAKGQIVLDPKPKIVPAKKLDCRGGKQGIARLPSCALLESKAPADQALVKSLRGGADLTPVFTSTPGLGGSEIGGTTPILNSADPWTAMMHETFHATFGFYDEYAYTKKEAKIFCKGETVQAPNMFSASSMPASFATEDAATEECLQRIPWCKEAAQGGAKVVTRAADGRFLIGTPPPAQCPDTRLGVYRGGACQAANPHSTWRPNFCPTIMGYPDIGEEHCTGFQRQSMLSGYPDIIPPYYQELIVNQIAFKTLMMPIQLPPNRHPAAIDTGTCPVVYGIPSVDSLNRNIQVLYDGCKLPMPKAR